MRSLILVVAIGAGLVSGALKALETPFDVEIFGRIGVEPEVLSLIGAVQLLSAVLMIFTRMRRPAGIFLAACYGLMAYLLPMAGEPWLSALSIGLAGLTLAAVFLPARPADA